MHFPFREMVRRERNFGNWIVTKRNFPSPERARLGASFFKYGEIVLFFLPFVSLSLLRMRCINEWRALSSNRFELLLRSFILLKSFEYFYFYRVQTNCRKKKKERKKYKRLVIASHPCEIKISFVSWLNAPYARTNVSSYFNLYRLKDSSIKTAA